MLHTHLFSTLLQLEREVERIREAHRLLEASASRRSKLEATMRDKLEQEIRRLKEDNIQQKGMHAQLLDAIA